MQLELKGSHAHHYLTEWGKWARSCPTNSMAYPHIDPFISMVTPGHGAPDITDALAIMIDTKIARMSLKHEMAAKVVSLYFYTGWNCVKLADEMQKHLRIEVSRYHVSEFVNIGVAWVDGMLEELTDS